MGVWKFKDLNIIRMTEDQETRFFESVFDQFTIRFNPHDTGAFKEALLYALYKGVAEGMQEQRENCWISRRTICSKSLDTNGS